jgi:hypothetical protein
MSAEAHVTSIWKKQKLFISVFLFVVAGWFLWDGKVNWPRSNERWLAQDEFQKSGHDVEWPAYAASRGWTTEKPHKLYKSADLTMQLACSGLCAVLGVIALAYWFAQKGRVLKSDAEAVYAPAGMRVPFGAITGLGKKKWDEKGLATVLYEIGGRKGKFVLDDYKFDRDPTHQILAEIEDKLLARTLVGRVKGEGDVVDAEFKVIDEERRSSD